MADMVLLKNFGVMQDTRSRIADFTENISHGFQENRTISSTLHENLTPEGACQEQTRSRIQDYDDVSKYKTQLNHQEQLLKQDTQQQIMMRQRKSSITKLASSDYFKTNFVGLSRRSSIGSELLPRTFKFNESSRFSQRSGKHNNDYINSQGISRQSTLPSRSKISHSQQKSSTTMNGAIIVPDHKSYTGFISVHDEINSRSFQILTCSQPTHSAISVHQFRPKLELLTKYLPGTIDEKATTDSFTRKDSEIGVDTHCAKVNGFMVPVSSDQKRPLVKTLDLEASQLHPSLQCYREIPANSSHCKAVRSSSYPMKLSPQPSGNIYNSGRRQSLQSSYTESFYNNCTSRNNGCNVSLSSTGSKNTGSQSSVNGKLPWGGTNRNHCFQRTVSHEPRRHEVVREIVKSSSCGEIVSEYLTLNQRFELPIHSQLCRVIEAADCSPEHTTNSFTTLSPTTISDTPVVHQHKFVINNDITCADPFFSASKLAIPYRSMQLVPTNTFSNPKEQVSGWKTSAEKCPKVAQTTGLVYPANNLSNSGNVEYPGLISNGKNIHNSQMFKTSGHGIEEVPAMTRCKSLPDLQNECNAETGFTRNYSDDEDGDDFGFLSYPISFSSSSPSTAMNKAKSPSPGNRIFPKRWRSKTKAVPAVSTSVAMWTPGPQGSCTWSSVSGRKVQLRPVSILNLTEPERMILQKIALSKLQSMDIGCAVSIPNDNSDQRRAKKSPLSLKRRSKSVATTGLDTPIKEGTTSGLVFGIPLNKCLMNDRELEKKRRRGTVIAAGSPASNKMRIDGHDNLQTPRCPRKSSSSSQGSLGIGGDMMSQKYESVSSHKRAASTDSLSESASSHNSSSSLIDALSLSTSNPASRLSSLAMESNHLAHQGEVQVPYVVKACFRHIKTYGLQTLGIFRVGSSKKRVKQLREEFDSGRDVQLTEEHNPHDVGALLKEYFRDLPDPLLTRELYLPFLHAERIKDEHKKHLAVSLLISMLPVANRDTLWALLQFLATVSQHATDCTDEKGEAVSGNKMDAHNLATLFGPNIIHRSKPEKSSDKEMMSESAERVEQSKEIIEVVKDMIDNHHELFEISGNIRDEVLRLLIESDQEVTDKILRHIANQNQIEADPESMCSVFEDSSNSPMLYHTMNSDADLLAYAQKQTTEYHRPLRITKSADDSLDSPLLKSRVPLLSESQAFSPTSRDNHRASSSVQQFDIRHSFPSPVPHRVPMLRVYPETANLEAVFPERLRMGNPEHLNSKKYNKNLNIPQPQYFRKNSSSSIGSDLYSLNGHSGSENGYSGQWILPTPPTSRAASPKPPFQSASSSSTLVAYPSVFNHSQAHDSDYENTPPVGSPEWERDRWKQWEKIAAQKRNMDTEQETLV